MYRIILILNVYLFTGRLTMSLVMEYLPFGSLIGYLESNRHNVSPRRLLLFASQICKVWASLLLLQEGEMRSLSVFFKKMYRSVGCTLSVIQNKTVLSCPTCS